MDKNVRKMNLVYWLVQGFHWCSACPISTYAAYYLKSQGYSNTELGMIICFAGLLAFVVPLFLSPLIDRSEKLNSSKTVIFMEVLEILLGFYMLLFASKGPLLSVIYVIWLALTTMIGPMCTQIALDYSYGGQRISFGVARAFGSFAFVFATAWLGTAVETISTAVLPATALVMSSLVIVCVIRLSQLSKKSPFVPAELQQAESLSLKTFIARHPSFTLLLAGIALVFMGSTFLGSYMINIVEDLGGNAQNMGIIHALYAFMEIPSMLFFARVGQKLRSNRLLIGSLVFFSVKILYFYFAWSIPVLYAGCVFQLLAYGMYTPAIVEYIRRSVPYQDSVKGQALAGAMTTFGSMTSSLLGGVLTDHISVKQALLVFFAISAAGSAVSVAAVIRSERACRKP